MRLRDEREQLLKTSGADVLSSRGKLRKTLAGMAPPPPHPIVCPRVNIMKLGLGF